MRNSIKLPVDFHIVKSNIDSIEKKADLLGLKISKDGYPITGEVRLGLLSFLKDGEILIRQEEIENKTDELNGAGSTIWKHFLKDLERNIPEAWDDNLYFATFFDPKNPRDQKTKFIFCLTKTEQKWKPMIKPVSQNFVPKEKDKLVCIIY